VTRQVEVFDPAVITIAHISSGTTNNIIPETARLEGTIRTFSERTRTVVHEGIVRLVNGLTAAYGATADVELLTLYPVTVNDPSLTDLVTATATELLGADAVNSAIDPVMGAEDFSYILQEVPGAMAFLGGRPASEDPATAPANHSNKVVFDEPAMAVGVATYVAVALRSLARS